ncbi:hypothetical protein ACIQ1J_25460 [Streptomyces sp. NPDC097107]|uniref:hypothetical protein n=1 Tax=Streptomyces sp. NPDC097107 TaxID=3366089 RepID=UPI00380AD15E
MTGTDGGGPADRAGTEADMGARHGEGADGDRTGPRGPRHGIPGTEELLAAALRGEPVDAEGERRAVAAFRAALDAGPGRTARTRRRDDWRPLERRRAGRTLKTALSVLLASLTLGGVAYAAIGGAGSATDTARPERTRPSRETDGTTVRPVPAPSPATTSPATASPGASARPDRPPATRDTEAHCRAYERLEGSGKALDATAWQRLVAAAGGGEHVAAHCAEQHPRQARPSAATDGNKPSGAADPTRPEPAEGNPNGGRSGSDNGSGEGGSADRAEPADRAPGTAK